MVRDVTSSSIKACDKQQTEAINFCGLYTTVRVRLIFFRMSFAHWLYLYAYVCLWVLFCFFVLFASQTRFIIRRRGKRRMRRAPGSPRARVAGASSATGAVQYLLPLARQADWCLRLDRGTHSCNETHCKILASGLTLDLPRTSTNLLHVQTL